MTEGETVVQLHFTKQAHCLFDLGLPLSFSVKTEKQLPIAVAPLKEEARPADANPADSSVALPEPAKRVSGAYLTRGAKGQFNLNILWTNPKGLISFPYIVDGLS